MEKFLENLWTQAEDNPILAIGVAAGVITAVSKLMNSTAWTREIRRRERMTR